MGSGLIRVARFAVVLAAAVAIALGVALAAAMIWHEVLVRLYGDDLNVIDDTPPMMVAAATSYLAGIAAGLVALVVGWRRWVRRVTADNAD